jgi:hypothetical protein|tara:strand:- start:433 stop:741 length:309 start_codon:yes stop_codon:yes gene_type:complete
MTYKNKGFARVKKAFKDDQLFLDLFLNANGYDNTKGMGNKYVYRMSISLDGEQMEHVNELCESLQITRSQLVRVALQLFDERIDYEKKVRGSSGKVRLKKQI